MSFTFVWNFTYDYCLFLVLIACIMSFTFVWSFTYDYCLFLILIAFVISKEAGCDDYIAKPIGYENLLSIINKYVPGSN